MMFLFGCVVGVFVGFLAAGLCVGATMTCWFLIGVAVGYVLAAAMCVVAKEGRQ